MAATIILFQRQGRFEQDHDDSFVEAEVEPAIILRIELPDRNLSAFMT